MWGSLGSNGNSNEFPTRESSKINLNIMNPRYIEIKKTTSQKFSLITIIIIVKDQFKKNCLLLCILEELW